MAENTGPYFELKSERVQRELAQLTDWAAEEGRLEGTFELEDGTEALAFLRRLALLLENQKRLPSRLALIGPQLTVQLGEERGEHITEADLALAGRISAVRDGLDQPFLPRDHERWMP